MSSIPGSRGVDVDSKTAKRTRDLITRVGETDAAVALGVHKNTLGRLCGRLPIHAGTLALVQARLDALPAESTTKETTSHG